MNNSRKRAKNGIALTAAAFCLILIGGTLVAAAGASDPAGGGSPEGEPQSKVVILVRHAEKDLDQPEDPPLTEAGVRRAEALANLLAEAGVTHLFASQYKRAYETLTPLASRLGLQVEKIAAGEEESQAAALRNLPAGSVAVLAGHANTVPALVELLGGKVSGLVDSSVGPIIDEKSHDRMFVVILPATATSGSTDRSQMVELRYGD